MLLSTTPSQSTPDAGSPGGHLQPASLPERVFQTMPWGVLVLDRKGVLRLLNPYAEQLLGLPATAVLGQPLLPALPADFPVALVQALQEASRGAAPVKGTFFLPHCHHWIDMTTAPGPDEVMVYWHDVSRRINQQQQYQALAENLPDVLTRWDADLRLRYANPALATKTGQPVDTLLGKTFPEMGVSASITAPYEAKLRRVFATGEPEDHFHAFPTPRGERCYHSRLVAERHNGQVHTVLAIARDVTELQQADAERRQSKELLEAVFNSSTLALHVLRGIRDAGGQLVDFESVLANASAERMAGGPTIGLRMLEAWPHTKSMGLFDGLVRTLETGQPLDVERLYEGEGFRGWYRWTAECLGDGAVMTVEDVTGRKNAEQELRQSQQLLRAVFDATLDSLEVLRSVRDANGQLVDFEWVLTNAAAHRLLQRTDLVGKRLLAEEPEMQTNGVFETLRQVVGGAPVDFELLHPQHGVDEWFHVSAAPLGDGLVATWHNITARKKATAELLRLEQTQQQGLANAVLDAQEVERARIAEGLHNGLGQVLYAAQLQVGQLRAGPDDGTFARSKRQAEELLQMAIADTRVLSHQLTPSMLADFGLVPALRQLCQDSSTPGHLLHCMANNLPPLPLPLALALYRMARELAHNVVQHAGATESFLRLRADNGWVELRADDNGHGFDPAGPFPGRRGLSTLRDRVRLLNGELTMVSSAEEGTHIIVRVPLAA